MKHLIPYLICVTLLVVCDLLWLGVIMPDFYRENIGHLMSGTVVFAPAVVFYFLYVAGAFVFVVLPAVREGKAMRALTLGVFLGLVAYGTYDLTNHATLRDWPLAVTVADMLWGALLTGLVSLVGYMAVRRAEKKIVAV